MTLDWFDPEAEASDLYYLLYPELQAAAMVGGMATLMDLAQQGTPMLGFDWSLPNEAAAAWAEKYTFELVKELTQTTQEQLQQAVSAFHATPGMTRGQLERLILQGPSGIPDLETAKRFYPAAERAEMIAVTETTRSYSAGNVEALKALGVDQVEPRQQPPKHVRCRCSIDPFPRDDGVMSWQWHTLNDELVCDECGPLNGLDVGEGVAAPEAAPPKPRDWAAEAAAARQKLLDIEPSIQQELADVWKLRDANSAEMERIAEIMSNSKFDTPEWWAAKNALEPLFAKETEYIERSLAITKSRNARYAAITQVEKPIDFKVSKLAKFEAKRDKAINEGVDAFKKMVDLPMPDNATVFFRKAGAGRASFTRTNSSVNATTSIGSRTVVHELGHWLESAAPGVREKVVAFLERRTQGEVLESLRSVTGQRGYAASEVTRKDKFVHPYIGKEYAGHAYTEVLSMGVEYMYAEPEMLANRDPDMFDFIWTVLRGG